MLFQIKTYFNFLLKSTDKHGIHSPFVYDLVSKCFNDKESKTHYNIIKNYRNSLVEDKTEIQVKDFGAGSKSLKSSSRKVSKIAKNAGIPLKRARLLSRVVSYLKAQNILEIGTSLGLSAASMSLGNPSGQIISLEGCENTAGIAVNRFRAFGLDNISVSTGNFKDSIPEVLKNKSFDLIYLDGNHQKAATIEYFKQCLPHIHDNSILIFDDIYWSKGMAEAWEIIKEHPQVTLTIDTYHWGMVFFRKEQARQHFKIRT